MKSSRSSHRALGIVATGRRVDAVLLEAGADGPAVSRLFSRARMRGGAEEGATGPGIGQEVPTDVASDVTLSFGDREGSGSELFLSSEFGGLTGSGPGEQETKPADTFELEMADLLQEARNGLEDEADLAFNLDAGDTEHVLLELPGSDDRDAMLEALRAVYHGSLDEDRVAFLPMSPADDGQRRVLAVFPSYNDPVRATLRKLVEQGERLPTAGVIDAEATSYISLVRWAASIKDEEDRAESNPAEEATAESDHVEEDFAASDKVEEAENDDEGNVVIVRAGLEDTLVISLRGESVQYCETLQSLTAYDVPDTICSRVLLQQDEHGLDAPQEILVLSEDRENELLIAFSRFFPNVSVASLRSLVPVDGMPEDGPAAVVAAVLAALRLMPDEEQQAAFLPVNFMPKKLLKRRVRVPVNVPAMVLGLFVIVTVVFFFASYSQAAEEISVRETRLEQMSEVDISGDVNALQAQIDSMRRQHEGYLHALDVLDSLMAGSDQWSRALEEVSVQTSNVEGIWVESMTPQQGSVRLVGNARQRDRVVAFARRIDGTIESLTFSEIREWPVFSFSILVPVSQGLPEAAFHLRDQVAVAISDSLGRAPAGESSSKRTARPVSGMDSLKTTAKAGSAR